MKKILPPVVELNEEVAQALAEGRPVVALESTVITHGLPYPENRSLALDMENEVREAGAIPATIALLDGKIQVGVSETDLERLAQAKDMHKISVRDFAPALAFGWSGGTTVAGTMLAAEMAGITTFATGGIGGVHRAAQPHWPSYDVSTDLPQLGRIPMIVVCAGAKAILDLPATLEYLETAGVPVVGYQTDEFPAFYSRSSGLQTSARAETPAEIAALALAYWNLGQSSAVLVVQPPPEAVALPHEQVDAAVERALQEAAEAGVRGQEVTPFLLARVSQATGGASMQANLGLLRNNAHLAALIAKEMTRQNHWQEI